MRFTRALAGLMALSLGCSTDEVDKPPPTSSAADPASSSATPPDPTPPDLSPITPPERFVRDPAVSEEVALEHVYKVVGKGVCKGLHRGEAALVQAQLTDDFRGRYVGAPKPEATDGSVELLELPAAPKPLDAAAFSARLVEHRDELEVVRRCKLKPYRFKLAETRDWAWADLSFQLGGLTADGKRVKRSGHWHAIARKDATGQWKLARVEVPRLVEVRNAHPGFSDVSAQVGVGMHRSRTAAKVTNDLIDNEGHEIDMLGGVGVIDYDHDGDDDILAWTVNRASLVFLNDGDGGFRKVENPIPTQLVGLFMLWLDLDGDGSEELVSSQIASCARGRAELPVFRRRGDGLQRVPGVLTYPANCRDWRSSRLSHILPLDADADGRLDLFVSGYSVGAVPRNHISMIDSHTGYRNLLFLNRGALKFEEKAEALGITGTRLTLGAVALDANDDGAQDLYVFNDFGPNELYLRRPDGTFQRDEQSPLVEGGYSMGATVADYNDDGRLDVYVSNMQSSAGNRIVPLIEGQIDPARYRHILGMAAGNTLYLKEKDGGFTEAAGRMKVAGANWAWGQATFDYDNDADRDLYVVNGFVSHSKIRDKDF